MPDVQHLRKGLAQAVHEGFERDPMLVGLALQERIELRALGGILGGVSQHISCFGPCCPRDGPRSAAATKFN